MNLFSKKKHTKAVARERLKWGRTAVQAVFFLAVPSLFSQAFAGAKEVAGAMGSAIPIIWSSFVIRLVVLCVLTILLGRVFCGWACAFGALGDWVYQFSGFIQKKAGKKLPQIPVRAIPILQKMKYLVLTLLLLICFMGCSSLITEVSPWTVFSVLSAGNFAIGGYLISLLAFGGVLAGMAVQERFFCQFLCPLGAVFSLLPELPFLKLKRNGQKCIPKCQACKKNCPVHIKIGENALQEGECIRCGRCVLTCPRKNIKIATRSSTTANSNGSCFEILKKCLLRTARLCFSIIS